MKTGFQNTKTAVSVSLPQIPFSQPNLRTETFLFQCEVMFGSPSSNCRGNGICKIVAKNNASTPLFKRTNCNHAHALFAACDDGNGAVLFFRRDWLCSNLMRRYLRHGIFVMPEPCPIPPKVVAALGLKINELPAGMHVIEDFGSHLRLHFVQNDS